MDQGGKKNVTQKRRLRPKLIIISKKGDMAYADILRKVKSDPELMDLGENVNRIRRSQKGDLRLELKKSPGKTVENFPGKVEKSLGEEAQVRARKQKIVIQCKDIDEITTKEDIRGALEKQFGPPGLQDSAIRGLRKAYGGMQTAIISLAAEAAFKLLAAGKVKIGWVDSGSRCLLSAALDAWNLAT